jgi:hypothetical protein
MYIRLAVKCNCIRERKLRPFPEKFRPYVRFDDNIIYLDDTENSTLVKGGRNDRSKTMEEEPEQIDPEWVEWCENGCEHENGFHASSVTIGPKTRLLPLITMLEKMQQAGLQNFLSAVDCSEPIELTPESVAECLIELYQFKSNFPAVSGTVVKDELSGTVVDILMGDGSKPLYSCETYQIGYDRDGLWATRSGLPGNVPEILFHSSHFRQDLLPYFTGLLEDKASGEYLEIRQPVFPLENNTYPQEVTIRYRELSPSDFDYLTRPYEQAFKASIATGNPVKIQCDKSAIDLE